MYTVFIPGSFFFGGGESPRLTIPPNGCQLCALSLFFGRDTELQIYHRNFLLIGNKHRKLFVIKQSKGCKFMPVNCTNIGLAAGLHPDPLGELMCSPYPVVKVDRRIRWHYTTTILRLHIGARLTRYRNCKFHNFARTISRHADGISWYSVPPSAGPLLPLPVTLFYNERKYRAVMSLTFFRKPEKLGSHTGSKR